MLQTWLELLDGRVLRQLVSVCKPCYRAFLTAVTIRRHATIEVITTVDLPWCIIPSPRNYNLKLADRVQCRPGASLQFPTPIRRMAKHGCGFVIPISRLSMPVSQKNSTGILAHSVLASKKENCDDACFNISCATT